MPAQILKNIVFALFIAYSLIQRCAALDQENIETVLDRLHFKHPLLAEFVQVQYLKGLVRPLKSSGRVSITAENEIRWEILSPVQSLTVIHSNGSLEIQEGARKTTRLIRPRNFDSIQEFLAPIYAGDSAALKRIFTVQPLEKDNFAFAYRLIPIEPQVKHALSSIEIRGGSLPEKIEIQTARGDKFVIDLSMSTQQTPKG